MPYSKQEIETLKQVKKILDTGIKEGPWQDSLFLVGIKKKIEAIRDKFEASVGASLLNASTDDLHHAVEVWANTTEVYISLYQSQGVNIQKWQPMIMSLVRSFSGRPVYENEDDARAATYLTSANPNSAYVVLKVDRDAIVSDTKEPPRVDRAGRKILTLREGKIVLSNVIRFVHVFGNYKLVGNFLIKQP